MPTTHEMLEATIRALIADRDDARAKLADTEQMVAALSRKASEFESDREYNAGLVAERDAELARLRSKGERMATAAREVVRDIDALAAQGLIRCAPHSADVTLRAALAEWEGMCGTCDDTGEVRGLDMHGISRIAKPCPDCTKGGERG